jgi:hypothetical protein
MPEQELRLRLKSSSIWFHPEACIDRGALAVTTKNPASSTAQSQDNMGRISSTRLLDPPFLSLHFLSPHFLCNSSSVQNGKPFKGLWAARWYHDTTTTSLHCQPNLLDHYNYSCLAVL